MMRYGFQTIDLPIIDQSDLFLTRAGDQAIEKLFTFERFGRHWALRPEFTASAALKYADNFLSDQNARPQIARWQFHSPIFLNQDNRHEATRDYQQYSIGAELIGANGSLVDAEIIAMAIKGIEAQGISNIKIKIGHVGLLRAALKQFDVDARTERFILNNRHILKTQSKDEMWQLLDAYIGRSDTMSNASGEFLNHSSEQSAFEMLSTLAMSGSRSQTMGGRTYEDIANRIIRKRKQASQISQIERIIDFIIQWINLADDVDPAFAILDEMIVDEELQSVLDNWRHTVDLLQALDIPSEHITIQPDLARDWNYYTGIVFEVTDSNDNTLAGGGRYDELVSLVSDGQALPAIGFAYYANNIINLITNQQSNFPMINITGEDELQVLLWANALRSYDLAITTISTELGERSVTVTSENEAKWSENKYSFENIHTLVEKIKQNARQ